MFSVPGLQILEEKILSDEVNQVGSVTEWMPSRICSFWEVDGYSLSSNLSLSTNLKFFSVFCPKLPYKLIF